MYSFDEEVDRRNTESYKWDVKEHELPMWVADMDFKAAPELIETLQQRVAHGVFGYSIIPEEWYDAYQSWWSRRHGFRMEKDWLIFCTGVVPAISSVVRKLTSPAENVIVITPAYNIFFNSIYNNGRNIVESQLKYEDGVYQIDLEDLEQKCKDPQSTLLILCNPHNPAGILWEVETLQRLASICRKNNILVISDEIHGDLTLYGKPHHPFATVSDDAQAIAITLGAPSKTFNIPGLVSSWVVIKNPELRIPFYQWLESNEFNASTFVATIATEVAYTHGAQWLAEATKYIEENIAAVIEYCDKHLPMLKPMRPQASFLMWLDCRQLGLPQNELVDLFVNKARLALNDGTMFGDEGEGFMRLNVACPRSVLIKALEQLANAIDCQ